MGKTRSACAAALVALGLAGTARTGEPWPPSILMAQLRAEAFRGSDPEATRRRAEAFLRGLGLRLEAYRDNEAFTSAELTFLEEGSWLKRIAAYPGIRRLRGTLSDLPGVKEVRENSMRSWTLVFKDPAYPRALRSLSSGIPYPHRLVPLSDGPGEGLWIAASPARGGDLGAAARRLRRRKTEVVWAEEGTSEGALPQKAWPLKRMLSAEGGRGLAAPRAF